MIAPFNGIKPKVHSSVFVAPGAHVIGDVTLARDVSVWFTAVLRADICPIRVGRGSNVQDGCVLHVDEDKPCVLKEYVIMGHQATAHGCVVEDGVLIGMGARILSGARIGEESVIAAGAVVLENAVIPPRSLVVGIPGKAIRTLSAAEVKRHTKWARGYVQLAREYKKFFG